MMRHQLYSIFDSAVAAYMRPFTAMADGQAIRVFTDEARRAGSEINLHPQDYSLFKIGSFDDNAAELVPGPVRCIARAHEVLAVADPQADLLSPPDEASVGAALEVTGEVR